LAFIDRLVRKALSGALVDRTEVLYVSPLKALGNDIQKNLETPLGEIMLLAGEQGLFMPEIRTAVRTGDTLLPERRAMLTRPPHILVTTPESLYILLTAEKSRAVLSSVEAVIVDEIHAVADDRRGTHLALSLERLEALTRRPLARIGLSATQKPIELIARFLVGGDRPDPVIVDIGHQRPLELSVEVPASELSPVAANELWDEIYDRIATLAQQHRSTLVERFFDESGGMQLVIHAPFGGRINKAWGLALRKRFCRGFNFELQAAATDEGINISLAEQHSFPLADVFWFLHPASVEEVLEQAVLASPIFTTRWRWNAGRALAVLRFRGGKRVPPQIQRMRADDLLASVFPDAVACQENLEGHPHSRPSAGASGDERRVEGSAGR
jgi:Lhr-like helicase